MKACKEAAANVIPLKPKRKKRLPWDTLYIYQKREILQKTAAFNSDPTQRNIKNFIEATKNTRNMLLERLKKYKTQLI